MRLRLPVWVQRLTALPEGLDDLAADATADGHRMLDVLREDWATGALRFDGPGEALLGAYAAGALLGVAGLSRDPYVREGPAGRVRRLYVRRSSRRHGVGRALLAAAVEAGREGGWPRLRVRAPAEAFAFYEACGFLRAVGEVSATHVMPLDPPSPGTP
jgi:GNAT superfamily N-acetyltransferase